jgi:hypothetical protein
MGFTCFACHHKTSEVSASLHLGSGVEPMPIPASFLSVNTRYALKVNPVTDPIRRFSNMIIPRDQLPIKPAGFALSPYDTMRILVYKSSRS